MKKLTVGELICGINFVDWSLLIFMKLCNEINVNKIFTE